MGAGDRAADAAVARVSGDVCEIVGDPAGGGDFVFTCEHAGRELPEWEPGAQDRPLVEAHWGWDIGAADLTRELAARTGSCAVLARFSRLICDPNRDPDEPSFVVEAVDGQGVGFNRPMDDGERRRRRERYFEPYHAAVDRVLRARRALGSAVHLCSVHSFTPVYRGRARPMEMGVLFDDHEAHARRLAAALTGQGFETALNAPYSGRDGLIYSARRHGRAQGVVYLELEVRQDLIDSREGAGAVAGRVARALEAYGPGSGAGASST